MHRISKDHHRETCLRELIAESRGKDRIYVDPNEDIYDVPDFRGCFTKSLMHDPQGTPDPKEAEKMIQGITKCWCNLDKITYPGSLRLINPSVVHSYDLVGPFKACSEIPPVPCLGSSEFAIDMIELYEMALLRDVEFKNYGSDPGALQACSELQVSPGKLFRGNSSGDLRGPYVSQFLWLPYSHGCLDIEQQYRCYPPGLDYMKTWDLALSCQNGTVTEKIADRNIRRYIVTLRDGATYVHLDDSIQCGLASACILDGLRCPGPKGSPFGKTVKEKPFIDLGRLDLLDVMTTATRAAMTSAWYHKWHICRVRPECVGMYVQKAIIDGVNVGLHSSLLRSPVLNRIYAKFGSYLLPQAYPEGSPCHPSYPAGHAVFSGVISTILKAFYDEDFMFDSYEPTDDGNSLQSRGEKLRVGDELDKLASNIAIFRNAAGVHYRTDAAGIELGEHVAIEVLKDYIKRYCHKVTFSFHKRNGDLVTISN